MNSYNENLHSSVVDSLNSQEMDLKKVNSETNASMFTLYYAEDATITAAEKLHEAKVKQRHAESRKKEAIDNSNISVNLLKSAMQSNQYLQQSVTNTAVAASNVQVASNSILKLASDIGSVYNIAQAADLDTDIFDLVEDANNFITRSAYAAEVASQIAMEASMLTSQVPASMLLDKAKNTNSSMNDLLKIISSDYDTKSQAVSAANAIYASDSTNEKSAEGNYEDISTVLQSTQLAYQATNKALNLGLTAVPEKGKESTNFNVRFDWIRNPFKEPGKPANNPVQDYYLIVVKHKQKNTFSIHNAEDILKNHPYRFIKLDVPTMPLTNLEIEAAKQSAAAKKDANSKDQVSAPIPLVPLYPMPIQRHFDQSFNYLEIPLPGKGKYVLQDSDGDEMTTGVNYIVFVMAVYQEYYKKALNAFSDFLSAPSPSFCLTYHLAKAQLNLLDLLPANKKADEKTTVKTIGFQVSENPEYADLVQYRCILLPVAENTPKGLVTAEFLKDLDKEIAELEKVSAKIDPQIAALNADILAKETQIETVKLHHPMFEYIEDWITKEEKKIRQRIMKNDSIEEIVKWCISILKKDHRTVKKLSNILKDLEKLIKEVESFIILLLEQFVDQLKVEDLLNNKNNIGDKITFHSKSKIGFLFNLTLAEQVAPGNYTPAVKPDVDTDADPKRTKGKTIITKMPADKPAGKAAQAQQWVVNFDASTTDNFGNLLVSGKSYIPVILSFSIAEEDNLSKFTNEWTGYNMPYYLQTNFE